MTWLLIIVSIVAANLPWLSDRIFFVISPRGRGKHFGWRLLELLVLYFVVGLLGLGLETRYMGETHAQGWGFYAVTFFLFLVFALPGFIYRYDLKPHLTRRH